MTHASSFDREPVHVRRAVLIAFKKSDRGFINFNEAPARHARISRELIQFGTDSHGRDARSAARCFAASALAALPALRAFHRKTAATVAPELHAAPLRCGERVFRPLGDHAPNQDQRPTLLRASVAL